MMYMFLTEAQVAAWFPDGVPDYVRIIPKMPHYAFHKDAIPSFNLPDTWNNRYYRRHPEKYYAEKTASKDNKINKCGFSKKSLH